MEGLRLKNRQLGECFHGAWTELAVLAVSPLPMRWAAYLVAEDGCKDGKSEEILGFINDPKTFDVHLPHEVPELSSSFSICTELWNEFLCLRKDNFDGGLALLEELKELGWIGPVGKDVHRHTDPTLYYCAGEGLFPEQRTWEPPVVIAMPGIGCKINISDGKAVMGTPVYPIELITHHGANLLTKERRTSGSSPAWNPGKWLQAVENARQQGVLPPSDYPK